MKRIICDYCGSSAPLSSMRCSSCNAPYSKNSLVVELEPEHSTATTLGEVDPDIILKMVPALVPVFAVGWVGSKIRGLWR